MKEIIDKILEEIKKQDTEKLIWSSKITPEITLDKYGGYYIRLDKSSDNTCWNVLKIYLIQTSKGISFREYIMAMTSPRHRRYNFFRYDNIERISNEDGGRIITIEDIPKIVEWILTVGYSVWGNKWGYVTKAGRKAKGRLYQLGYRIESYNKEDFYLINRKKT